MFHLNDIVLLDLSYHLFGRAHHLFITVWTLFGWTGNVLFSARVLTQWWASERARHSVVPVAFWWLSILATLVQLFYSFGVDHVATMLPFIIGLAITIVPYVRNLAIHYRPRRPPLPMGPILAASFILVMIPTVAMGYKERARFDAYLLIGLAGMFVWSSRFFISWLESERERKNTLSLTFWWVSLIGSGLMLTYSFIRSEPVFIVSFIFNFIPYVRNIMLIRRAKSRQAAPVAGPH